MKQNKRGHFQGQQVAGSELALVPGLQALVRGGTVVSSSGDFRLKSASQLCPIRLVAAAPAAGCMMGTDRTPPHPHTHAHSPGSKDLVVGKAKAEPLALFCFRLFFSPELVSLKPCHAPEGIVELSAARKDLQGAQVVSAPRASLPCPV